MIKIKIDVTKITKERLFKGKANAKTGKCPMYLDAVMIETKPTQYGDWRDDQTHMIVEDVSKADRDKGIKGNIIGNASDMSRRRTNDKPPADPSAVDDAPPITDDDCPF